MIILVGKTCSGKDAIRREIIKNGFDPVVTYTTRPPRYGEVNGASYNFISDEEFNEKEKNGFFVETTSYEVEGGFTWKYGTAKDDLQKDKVIIVNPEGLKKLVKFTSLNPVVFYIMSSDGVIWNRLRQRGDDSFEARRRMNADDNDFVGVDRYVDFAIRNDGHNLLPKDMADMILYLYSKAIKNKGE